MMMCFMICGILGDTTKYHILGSLGARVMTCFVFSYIYGGGGGLGEAEWAGVARRARRCGYVQARVLHARCAACWAPCARD